MVVPNSRLDQFSGANGNHEILEVHPVFIVIFGTTMAELAPVVEAQNVGISGIVPYRVIVVDSLPYGDLVTRLVQNNWTRDQVVEAIPRANYFQLVNPFVEGFDFGNPLNRSWLNTIFEPALERLASKPDAPGCAGTPALGRARVEGSEQELRAFFENHSHQLTQIRTETLGLQVGVKVFVVTTFRGGTGAGSVTPGSSILRSVMAEGSIHLHAVMPDVYGGDNRAHANSFAAVRELQYTHRFNGGVAFKDGRVLPSPFDTSTLTFASNGAVALRHGDALMQEAAILGAHLRARTQSTINSRGVDLTDVAPFTITDDPMHLRIETSVSVRNVLPGTIEYIAAKWCHQVLKASQDSFEEWCQNETLSFEEREQVTEITKSALKDLALNRAALLSRIEGAPGAANTIRAFFEQATTSLGSMESAAIKKSMSGVPAQVRNAFLRFEPAWEERAQLLARALPEEITNYVMSRIPEAAHLALAVVAQVSEQLVTLAKECRTDAENERKKRDAASAQLGHAMGAVQDAKGLLGIFQRHEVTRDAAQTAFGIAMVAALARIEQQRLEHLVQVLEGEMVSMSGRGKPIVTPSVISALRTEQVGQIALIRKRQGAQLSDVKQTLEALAQKIEKRSQVFQRTLLYDQVDLEQLNRIAQQMRDGFPLAPPILQLLKEEQNLSQTITDLLPLLPFYLETGRTLTEILAEDAVKRDLVIKLLRNRMPFTPLDRVVEDQQGLKNRRDTLVVLEVPGGADGQLGSLMLREAIVSHPNQIVDSGEDEIRLYYLRDGLPYAAVRSLVRYRERHDTYLSNPAAITPYTQARAHLYPGLEPSRVNLRTRTEEILYVAKAVLQDSVVTKPSGGFLLRYQKAVGHGFMTTQEENFDTFTSMVIWLAKQVATRKMLEAELASKLDADPEDYKSGLVKAWQVAVDKEREYLQEALFALKVDPYKFAIDMRQSGTAPAPQGLPS